MDRPVVGPVLPAAGRHRCQFPGAVLHALHRGGLLRPDQLHLHLRRFQEDDQAGPPPPHTHLLRPRAGHSVRLPLHVRCVAGCRALHRLNTGQLVADDRL